MTKQDKAILKSKIASTFTPSSPIDKFALFAGRVDQITKLVNAINQKGQHAILFGERGVGKTSLANVLRDIILDPKSESRNVILLSTNCESKSTFSTIWRHILSDIKIKFQETGMGFNPPVHFEEKDLSDVIGEEIESAEKIRQIFQKYRSFRFIIIIDEIDQIKTKGTTKSLADTIKTLSDRAINSTLILIGVADSVDQLISDHASIERALVQILMPRMDSKELSEIISKGLKTVGIEAGEDIKIKISSLSQGLPHYTHLLSLHAAQTAVERDSFIITIDDVNVALEKAVEQAQQSIMKGYVTAVTSRRGNLYAHVLTACALAQKAELSYFSASDVKYPLSEVMGKQYEVSAFGQHLNSFCEESRGRILQRFGSPRRYRYRFSNPLMEPYVIIKALSKKIITNEILDLFRR